ncbi:MAG: plasmid partitioning protein RepB C-terminal domain-containing protein [Gemmatales bacterium]
MLTPAVYSLLLLCGFEQPKDDYVYLSLLRTSSRMYVMEGISAEVREGYLNRYGVFISESKALITSIRRRHRMLNGICPDAAEILKDTECPLSVFDILRQMAPFRQIEAAELMTGQNNFTGIFAKALLAATPEKHLIESRKEKWTRKIPYPAHCSYGKRAGEFTDAGQIF